MQYNFDAIINRRQSNSIKWKVYPEDVLPMWVADMDFAVPPAIQNALTQAVQHGIFGYEMPGKELLSVVSKRMKALYDWDVDEKSIVPVTGLVSGFYAAASTLCRPGDGYMIQTPVYMPFNDLQKDFGFIRQEAELVKITEGATIRYEIDWNTFEKAFHQGNSQTKMFLLCNPHNPTGQVYSREELAKMAELCLKNGTVIVSDEIHSELLLGGARHTPLATLSPEIENQTITLIAPSKTFNIAGLFCGFAIIPNAELRRRFETTVNRMTLHVSSLAQVAAEAAFSGACDDWLVELQNYLTSNRDYLVDFVQKNLPGVKITIPQATYLAWLDFSELVESGKIQDNAYEFILKNARVALNNGPTFGTGGKNFVRLNFGCPRALLQEGLERIQKSLV